MVILLILYYLFFIAFWILVVQTCKKVIWISSLLILFVLNVRIVKSGVSDVNVIRMLICVDLVSQFQWKSPLMFLQIWIMDLREALIEGNLRWDNEGGAKFEKTINQEMLNGIWAVVIHQTLRICSFRDIFYGMNVSEIV